MAENKDYEFYGVIENNVLLGHRTAINGSPNIAIPDGVVKIRSHAFEGEGCKKVIIPSSVKVVGNEAFNHCEKLREAVISEGVEELEDWAFNGCYSLQSVHIPSTLTKINLKQQPFNNCRGLTKITVAEDNPVFRAEGNCLIHRATGTVVTGCANSVIPTDGSIKAIGDSAFCRQRGLKKIIIPDGVTRIGKYAFLFCSELAEVELPDSVEELGVSAFERCESLTKIKTDNLLSISDGAFCGCDKLNIDVVISDNARKVGTHVFAESGIRSVVIGRGISVVSENLFRNCEALEKVVLHDGITKIDKSAFINCEALEHIDIPPSVTYIGKTAFYGCSALKGVVLPPNAEFISKDAFQYCAEKVSVSRKLSNPDFEMDGTNICKYRGKSADVVIPEGVTAIKAKAFRKKKIKSVVISSTVKTIAGSAFEDCDELCSIAVAEGNAKYYSFGNCIIDRKNKVLLCGCNSSVLPESGIERIGAGAFFKCKSLKSVIIPKGVKLIGNKAFEQCVSLEEVSFPEGLEHVGENAFSGCKNLKEANFKTGLKVIGDYAFYECENLSSLVLPIGLKSIECQAFYNCKKLEVLDFPDGLESIVYLAFRGCDNVKSISLPATATDIYNAGFESNANLQKITVAEGNEKYSSKGNCLIYLNLNQLRLGCATSVIPDDGTVTKIESDAFANSDIENLVIPEGVTFMHPDAVKGCKKLKSVTLPDSLKRISSAFEDTQSLERVTAPERFREHFKKINEKIKFIAID